MQPTESFRVLASGLHLLVHRWAPLAPRGGPPVLLLHGFLDAGSTWDEVAGRLAARGHEVFAPDLRGFGGSDRLGGGGYYHFPDYVADVAALTERLDLGPFHLAGHSMGGTIAALFAGTLPARVERLALLEGLGTVATDPSLAVERMRAWLRDLERAGPAKPMASLEEAAARLARSHPRVPPEALASRARLLTKATDEGLAWAFDPLHRTTSPTPFSVDNFAAFLRAIACPVLFVGGGPAGWHPPDEAERLACVRDLRRIDLPEAGHMMHWSAPEALADALGGFFAPQDRD